MKDKAGVISEVFFFSPLWFEKHSLPSKGLPNPAPVSLLTWMFQGPLTSGCAALEFPALLGFQKVENQRWKCLGDPRKGCGVPGEFYQVSGRRGCVQADFPGDAHPSRCYVRFIIPAHPVLSTSNSSQAFDLVHLAEELCTSDSWQPQLPAFAWAPPTLTLSTPASHSSLAEVLVSFSSPPSWSLSLPISLQPQRRHCAILFNLLNNPLIIPIL